jgi:hydrogenase-4 component F
VAFGIGTPLAIFAGLLHMLAHALAKTSAFFSAGQIIQTRKSHMALDIRGLVFDKPALGWGILLSSCILIGLPPSALFISEFLIIFSMFKQHMLLAIPMMLGLLIAAVAIFYRVQQMVFLPRNEMPPEPNLSFSILPIYLHIVLLGILGISIPFYLSGWFESIITLMSAE